jgi:hypothetical protein
VSDDAGFAAAGAGQKEDGAIDGEDSLALLRVHVGEEIRHSSILSFWDDAISIGGCSVICLSAETLMLTFRSAQGGAKNFCEIREPRCAVRRKQESDGSSEPWRKIFTQLNE